MMMRATSVIVALMRQHHRDDEQEGQDAADHPGQRLLESVAQRVDIIGHPAEHIAERMIVKVADRQPLDLLLERIAQIVHRSPGWHPSERTL